VKKGILPILVASLMILTIVGASCTTGTAVFRVTSESLSTPDPVIAPDVTEDVNELIAKPLANGTGTIKGTITNQNGKPIAFVRVVAVGNPKDPSTQLGFTMTHLLFGEGKGRYSMKVPSGRYLFVRAAKLPFYIGAWAGPVTVGVNKTITLDLSISYIGPKSVAVASPAVNTNQL
jgi:hypothetical protein